MFLTVVLNTIIIGYLLPSTSAIGPLGAFGVGVGSAKCEPSITTASGSYAIHKGKISGFNSSPSS